MGKLEIKIGSMSGIKRLVGVTVMVGVLLVIFGSILTTGDLFPRARGWGKFSSNDDVFSRALIEIDYTGESESQADQKTTLLVPSVASSTLPALQPKPSKKTPFIPQMYIITPTYSRATQMADLTQLFQTFQLTAPMSIQVVVVEDTINNHPSGLLRHMRKWYTKRNPGMKMELLVQATPKTNSSHRGVFQRNKALDWITENQLNTSAPVYFVDDDNTYDVRVFNEFLQIGTKSPVHRVGMLPVGLLSGRWYQGPVCKDGDILHFHNPHRPERTFPLDMAGFAFTVESLIETKARFHDDDPPGLLETAFLCRIAEIVEPVPWGELALEDKSKFVGLADDCSHVYVWHTKTQPFEPKIWDKEAHAWKIFDRPVFDV